jgi:hypothetical protein
VGAVLANVAASEPSIAMEIGGDIIGVVLPVYGSSRGYGAESMDPI